MTNKVNKNIAVMKSYSPPLEGRREYKGFLMDFNERVVPPGPKVTQAIYDFLDKNQLQVYPEYSSLEAQIAEYAGVRPEEAMVVNGSDQGIDLIFRTFTSKNGKVVIPSPSFAMFYQCAGIMGNRVVKPKYGKDFPLGDVLNSIDKETELIVICNPNNPTGTLISLRDIEKILKKASDSIVYVDEAYFEFSGVTAASLIGKYPNLVITRTFSKAFGLAALRIGYVLASEKILDELKKVRGPYDVNMISACAVEASLKDSTYVYKYVNEIMDISKKLVEEFFVRNNIDFYPSGANFILFKPGSLGVLEVLKENGFLLRPREDGFVRLTICTSAQMKEFIKFYRVQFLQKYAFLDRDGALIYEPTPDETLPGNIPYQIDTLEKLKILPGVVDGLKRLNKSGYKFVMASNQDGLGTKIFPRKDFEKVQQRLLEMLRDEGIEFEDVFVCPHTPEENCNCRKPKTGLLDDFFDKNLGQIDMENSFVYGDRKSDQKLAKNLNLKFIKAETNGKFNSDN